MKLFTLVSLILTLMILSSTLNAEQNKTSLKTLDSMTVYTAGLGGKSENKYNKVKRVFSKYDKTWAENMFVYAADVMIPDEIIVAIKDVMDNRNKKSYSFKGEKFPERFGNDTYNIFLTTTYHYMQDISQITNTIWDNAICHPDTFKYDPNLNPKQAFLYLKQTNKEARGITKKGIILPINKNFPDAFYPYASRPNGCSAEELQSLYNNSNKISDDSLWLEEACNEHDRCYSTLGTTYQECNDNLIVQTIDSCNHISTHDTALYFGSKNAFCGIKGFFLSLGAGACAEQYFNHAQRQQKIYEQWVSDYEEMYLKNKQR